MSADLLTLLHPMSPAATRREIASGSGAIRVPDYEITVGASSSEVRRAIEEAIELGYAVPASEAPERRLLVPLSAGIRTGSMVVDWALETSGTETRILLEVRDESLRTSPTALAILVMGALGGLMTVVWPLHPDLLGLAPLGALLALLAWLLVVSRLRSHGPDDFLATVADLATEEAHQDE